MLKRRDPVTIGNVGAYTERSSEYLKAALDKLVKDINSVNDVYKGVDANVQINNFIATANKLNSVIKNLNYYGKYMQNISSFDRDNLNSVKKNFNQIINQPVIEEGIQYQTLSLDSINTNVEGDINE